MARRTNTRYTRDEFVILTNGKESETNYFELIKSYKSVYNVKVKFSNSDPLRLVQEALRYKGKANQVWVVFDVDNSHEENRFIPAIKFARENGIKYAISNISFEVWLISHFQKCEKRMNVDELIRIINNYLTEKGCKGKYEKNNENILCDYFLPNYKVAIENSKSVYQKRKLEHIQQYGENSLPKYWEWNSFTSVFKLIEALKLSKEYNSCTKKVLVD